MSRWNDLQYKKQNETIFNLDTAHNIPISIKKFQRPFCEAYLFTYGERIERKKRKEMKRKKKRHRYNEGRSSLKFCLRR